MLLVRVFRRDNFILSEKIFPALTFIMAEGATSCRLEFELCCRWDTLKPAIKRDQSISPF